MSEQTQQNQSQTQSGPAKEMGREAGEQDGAGASDSTAGTDLISVVESDLTLLIQIMSSSIHYISNKSAHVQLNSDIPLYNPVGAGQLLASKMLVDEKSMMESIEELTDDLVGKVKDIEKLVEQLPKERDDEEVRQEIDVLHQQMAGVNEEYRTAAKEASELSILSESGLFPSSRILTAPLTFRSFAQE
jgi:hypothetical protein